MVKKLIWLILLVGCFPTSRQFGQTERQATFIPVNGSLIVGTIEDVKHLEAYNWLINISDAKLLFGKLEKQSLNVFVMMELMPPYVYPTKEWIGKTAVASGFEKNGDLYVSTRLSPISLAPNNLAFGLLPDNEQEMVEAMITAIDAWKIEDSIERGKKLAQIVDDPLFSDCIRRFAMEVLVQGDISDKFFLRADTVISLRKWRDDEFMPINLRLIADTKLRVWEGGYDVSDERMEFLNKAIKDNNLAEISRSALLGELKKIKESKNKQP